jgi:hypothetical protein
MGPVVTNTAEQIRATAREKGLVPVDGSLIHAQMPHLRWMGEWQEFLNLAEAAGARLIYIEVVEFHPQEMVIACVSENLDDFVPESEDGSPDIVDQMYHRLEEAIMPWRQHEGDNARLVSTWVIEGVAHVWKAEQQWYVECRQAMEEALDHLFEHWDPRPAERA